MTTMTETGIEARAVETGASGSEESRLRRLTRAAGVMYLAIFVIYPLATMVRSTLVVPGDATATTQNIAQNESLFRWGMAGEATIFLIEIILASVLYAILRPVSRSISLAAALARVSEGVVMAAGTLFTSVLTLAAVGGPSALDTFEEPQQEALALFFQEANEYVILMWGLFFALSLVLTGWLVYRSGFLPRTPGVLLVLAGVGYFAQSFGTVVAPGLSGTLSTIVLVLAIPGELVFALWLLIKGIDQDKWQERALRPEQARL